MPIEFRQAPFSYQDHHTLLQVGLCVVGGVQRPCINGKYRRLVTSRVQGIKIC